MLVPRCFTTLLLAGVCLAIVGGQTAEAGLFDNLKAKFCKKDSCCEPEPVCCEPEPACDACGSEMIISETTTEVSPSEEPTPADPAPEPPMEEEAAAPEPPAEEEAAMTEREMKIAEMKAAASAAVKKAAGESVGASAGN
ncbi:MAG: hypothetical protein AAF596_05335 [Planctomycetota bacterium]